MNIYTTIKQKRESIAEEIRKITEDKQQELRLLEQFPGDLPTPIISNIRRNGVTWVSFRMPIGMMDMSAFSYSAIILTQLEAAGFAASYATLAKYGMYRPGVHPGLQEELPERYSNQGLDWSEPIAPLWITLLQAEAIAFYRAPDQTLLRISCPISHVIGIYAARQDFQGGWSYVRGSAKLRFPQSWHSITDKDDGTPITQISNHSRAYVDTEQGISGALYFTPLDDPFPLTPAEFLQRLEAQSK